MSYRTRRIRRSSGTAEYDEAIVAHARAAIERSLQILRDSRPEAHLGRNYYAPRVASDAPCAGELALQTAGVRVLTS